MNFRKIEGFFLHGIDLSNWMACWNFTLSKKLVAANFLPLVDPSFASQRRIEEISIEELTLNPGSFTGTMTPRSLWFVWAASIIRAGGHVGIGEINTKWHTKEEMDRLVRIGDAELQLEKIRRDINPSACSRLGCLWVADDNPEGLLNIRSMLGPLVYVAKVQIPVASKFTKADRRYFDLFIRTKEEEYAVKYWSEKKYGLTDSWEYLVEGVIESTSEEDIKYIKENGKTIFRAIEEGNDV